MATMRIIYSLVLAHLRKSPRIFYASDLFSKLGA